MAILLSLIILLTAEASLLSYLLQSSLPAWLSITLVTYWSQQRTTFLPDTVRRAKPAGWRLVQACPFCALHYTEFLIKQCTCQSMLAITILH